MEVKIEITLDVPAKYNIGVIADRFVEELQSEIIKCGTFTVDEDFTRVKATARVIK